MTTRKHEFHAHNSPWTEIYDMHCQQEEQQAGMTMSDTQAEQEPTHDALADVYNCEITSSKRF